MAILFDCSVDYLLEIDGAVFDTDKVVDLNGFILNEKYTIASRFPTKHDRKIINSFINSIFRSCFNRKKVIICNYEKRLFKTSKLFDRLD